MKRNLNWMRCCSNVQAPVSNPGIGPLKTTNLQALQFADSLKLGTVNLLDVLAATTPFGFGCAGAGAPSSTCYFAHPLYSTGLQSQCRTGNTAPCDDIGVVSTIASYFGSGTTAPFLGTSTGFLRATPPAGLINYDPNVDPRAFLVRGNIAYIQGVTPSGTTLTLGMDPCVGCTWSVFQDTATGPTIILQDDDDTIHILLCGPISVDLPCTGIPIGVPLDIMIYDPSNPALNQGQFAIIEFGPP
jgi:hypothetical protein